MAEDGKSVERQRLAAALRANLKRRKVARRAAPERGAETAAAPAESGVTAAESATAPAPGAKRG